MTLVGRICLMIVLCSTVHSLSTTAFAEETARVCPQRNSTPILPDDVHGIISRTEINPVIGPSVSSSIQPNLFGLGLERWIGQLEAAGVNVAEFSLQPDVKLANQDLIPPDLWQKYQSGLFLPEEDPKKDRQNEGRVESMISAQNGVRNISKRQQTEMFLTFLEQLESLKQSGKICGNIQFVLEQRRWFRNVTAAGAPVPFRKQIQNEKIYARTVADVINGARARHLDHWLAGMMLTEHTNTDMNQLLPIALDLAGLVNDATGGWLKSRLFIVAGGGFGSQFNGIDRAACTAEDVSQGHRFDCVPGQDLDFFGRMSKQVGSFAFAYKMFIWPNAPTKAAFCSASGCDPRNMTTSDWRNYLGDSTRGLGFDDLIEFVGRNAARHPRLANVIYIGNPSDSLYGMLKENRSATAPLCAGPQLRALTGLFQAGSRRGGGWKGRFFMDGFRDVTMTARRPTPGPDDGTSLFFVGEYEPGKSGGRRIVPNRLSQKLWNAWPDIPESMAGGACAP